MATKGGRVEEKEKKRMKSRRKYDKNKILKAISDRKSELLKSKKK